jgi:probable rRNA maturation factor|tara:strand:- start:1051 stop:1470 length:420 start_codon:yes stop_codon:yes gene_type:complete
MPINIYDSNFYTKKINKSIFNSRILKSMKYLKINNKSLDISFISQYMMKKINYKYRKINKSTDVLSFFYDYSDSVLMGEIFISIKDAEKNCNKNNNTLLDECSILTIHGILHLLGYDHDTKKKEQSMFDLQEKIYKKVI